MCSERRQNQAGAGDVLTNSSADGCADCTGQIKSKFNIGRQAPTTPVTTDYHKKQQQQQEQQKKQHQEQRQQKHTDRDSQKLFQEKVGTLLYLASTARPDLATAASYLGEAMQQATEEDMRQADRALAFATARRGALQTRKGDVSGKAAEEDCTGGRRSRYKQPAGYTKLPAPHASKPPLPTPQNCTPDSPEPHS